MGCCTNNKFPVKVYSVLRSKIIHINCNKELSNETINAINKAVEIAYNIK